MQGPDSSLPMLVAIGASAGGLEALKILLPLLPADRGFVFVVVVHLNADQPSLLADVLQPFCAMPVRQVTADLEMALNHVYVIPPGKNLSTIDSHLRLTNIEERRDARAAIDHFFETLANTHGDRCIGVILSGTGSDGSFGVRRIKEQGGLTIAQDPTESQFDSMPQNAIATGLVDLVLPIREMPRHMVQFATTLPRIKIGDSSDQADACERALVQSILMQVRARTNMDFAKYKQSTILRRIRRRMQLHQTELLEDYLEYLRANPSETHALAEEFLITVTQFFRDAEVYEYVKKEVIPKLFEGKNATGVIRVWSVGCATGEEAYSLAIILLEHASQVTDPPRIEIFASDMHEMSLRRAREGVYSDAIELAVAPERLRRFFVKDDNSYRVRKEVRDIIVFASHNLLRDPPFSRLDLIACRNLMIYLNRELQNDVIDLFHYALNPDGLLLLGPSESIDRASLFEAESKTHCVYRRRNVPAREPRLPVFPQPARRLDFFDTVGSRREAGASYGALHQKMVERYAPPSLLVDQDFRIVHASEHAGRYLLVQGGELSASIFRLAREELRIELRTALHAASERGESSRSSPIPIELDGQPKQVILHVRPSRDPELGSLVLVIFDEYPADSVAEPSATGPDAIEARAELEATKERLQAVIEQYETSQEEMRAANEELQSINEELRSTMEELETSKEELQSMNEELQTVNQENRHRVEELSQLTADLQNLMASTDIATLFLDRELRIMRVTPRTRDLFNIRASDHGRPFTELRHRLRYDNIEEDAARVLATLTPVKREIQSDSGEWYLTRLNPYRSSTDQIQGVAITLVDITDLKNAELSLRNSEENFRALVSASAQAVWTTDAEGLVVEDSPTWRQFTGQSIEQRRAEGWKEAIHPDDRDAAGNLWRRSLDSRTPFEAEFRLHHAASNAWRWTHARAAPLYDEAGKLRGWVAMNTDINERMTEIAQQEALREANRRKDEFLALLGHELRNPLAPLRNAMSVFDRTLPGDHALRHVLGVAERQVTQLTRLVDQLLDVARISAGGMELKLGRVDMRDIARAAVDAVEEEVVAKRHELSMLQPTEPVIIDGDEVRLLQMVTNLLDNAIKYTTPGGKLRLETQRDGAFAVVSVSDNGAGLAPESLERIFDVFARVQATAHGAEGGLGLGLPLVRRLVEAHGGSIEARSDGLGKGSEFVVRLPLSSSREVAKTRERETGARKKVPRRRILVVDDIADVAHSSKQLLELDGHEVRVAHDGEGALRVAAEYAPEVVILDIGLPDMTGYELARRLRELDATSGALLIAASGFGQKEDLDRSAQAGIDKHMVKPVDFDALTDVLRGPSPAGVS